MPDDLTPEQIEELKAKLRKDITDRLGFTNNYQQPVKPSAAKMWSDIRKAVDIIKRNERIAIVPVDFPEGLEAQVKRLPHIVAVQRSNMVPSGHVYIVPANPELLTHPPI